MFTDTVLFHIWALVVGQSGDQNSYFTCLKAVVLGFLFFTPFQIIWGSDYFSPLHRYCLHIVQSIIACLNQTSGSSRVRADVPVEKPA